MSGTARRGAPCRWLWPGEDVGELIHAAVRTTGLLVRYDQSEAPSLADHVSVMRNGTLAQVGTPRGVSRAAHLEVAEFVGAAVVVDADVVGCSASCDLGPLPVTPGHKAGLMRPVAAYPPGGLMPCSAVPGADR